ncbi:MAG: 3-oxoacyl-[acyl-carrier-protein] synthase [Myxococcaceae bacterium]|nr:3-oxoacyl-[acyl-carrier-protein] synthase [Myxococcaceae bacterium]
MRRVVVTGYGAISPCGPSADLSFDAIKEGKSGIGPITLFDASEFTTRFAGECRGFNAEEHVPRRDVRSMDRFVHFAVAAAHEAVRSAGVADAPEAFKQRIGTLIGVGIGGLGYLEAMCKVLDEKGPGRITPYFIPATIANLAPGQISMKYGFKGSNYATTSACSSGAHAIGEGFRAIERGELDGCLTGGAEAAVTPLGIGGFAAMRALSRRNDAPAAASRPWDQDRDGFVAAEGAGLLFLEEREHALARGATLYAEIVGYGSAADAFHITTPAPEGEGAQRSMRAALRDAKLEPAQIDYLNAHATSTPQGDLTELQAIEGVFLQHAHEGLWISSTKSHTGHMLGAAGGFEAVVSVLALRDGVVPATLNLERPDPASAGFDLVPGSARTRDLRYVLSNSFGFGGTNASLIFSKV